MTSAEGELAAAGALSTQERSARQQEHSRCAPQDDVQRVRDLVGLHADHAARLDLVDGACAPRAAPRLQALGSSCSRRASRAARLAAARDAHPHTPSAAGRPQSDQNALKTKRKPYSKQKCTGQPAHGMHLPASCMDGRAHRTASPASAPGAAAGRRPRAWAQGSARTGGPARPCAPTAATATRARPSTSPARRAAPLSGRGAALRGSSGAAERAGRRAARLERGLHAAQRPACVRRCVWVCFQNPPSRHVARWHCRRPLRRPDTRQSWQNLLAPCAAHYFGLRAGTGSAAPPPRVRTTIRAAARRHLVHGQPVILQVPALLVQRVAGLVDGASQALRGRCRPSYGMLGVSSACCSCSVL